MESCRVADNSGLDMAGWQNGYAADCKSVYLGSTPGPASILTMHFH